MSIEEIRKFKEFLNNVNDVNDVNDRRLMIVTHFPPIGEGTSDAKYSGDILNRYFSWLNMLDSENIKRDKIKLWCSSRR
jgi:hypothetical protein